MRIGGNYVVSMRGAKVISDNFLNRNVVTYLKAIAIVLMVIHHCWGFPEWVLEENSKAQFSIGGGV